MRTAHRQRRRFGGPFAWLGALLGLIAAVIVVILLISSGGGSGGSGTPGGKHREFESMFQDDALLVYGSTPAVQQTLKTLKALGVDRVRITVKWSDIAPDSGQRTPPAHFNASDPASYPQTSSSGWANYDRLDLLASRAGIAVDFDLTAPAPLWATTAGAPSDHIAPVFAPSVKDFGQFATAVGKRYDGSYKITFAAGQPQIALPAVHFWTVWNEPNQPGWLAPQFQFGKDGRTMVAPGLYREYVDAAWSALHQTGHGSDQIMVGELAPEGCTLDGKEGNCSVYSKELRPIPPIPFLQSMYCLDAAYKPLTGTAAADVGCPKTGSRTQFVRQNPALFDATAFTHHPYSFDTTPTAHLSEPSFVPIADLSRLETALDRAFAAYGSHRRIPLYLDEYGYETNPPDPFRGMSLTDQAAYLDEAAYMAWANPRVQGLSQFELVDAAPLTDEPKGSHAYWSSFQTGLLFQSGAQKPSFAAYRLPIALPSAWVGGHLTVWGMLRPARNGSTQHAQILWSDTAAAPRVVATVTVSSRDNTFETSVPVPDHGSVQIRWTPPGGQAELSRAAPVTGSGLR